MINNIFLVVVGTVIVYAAFVAAATRHEQKKLWRQGKTDYYGNPKK